VAAQPEPPTSLPASAFSDDNLEDWSMSLDEWTDHQFTFRNADYDGDGKLNGHEAAPILTKLGADKMQLRHIWTMVDQDSDGFISSKEFCAAMHLAGAAANGRPLPSSLPVQLTVRPDSSPKAKRAAEPIASLEQGVGSLGLGQQLEDAPLPPLGATADTGAFGQPQQQNAFGQPQQQQQQPQDTGAFGQPQQQNAFGQPQQQQQFQQPQDTGAFGQSQQQNAFGQPQQQQQFQQPQDTGAFGQPQQQNAFGQPQQQQQQFQQPQDTGAFGQPQQNEFGRQDSQSLEAAVAKLEAQPTEEEQAAQIQAAKEEQKRLQLETTKVERARRERQDSISQLEQEKVAAKSKLEELRGKQDALDEGIERDQREHGRLKHEVTELRARLEQSTKAVEGDATKLEALRVEIRGLQEEKQNLTNMLPDASTSIIEQLKASEATFLQLRGEVSSLKEVLGNVEQETKDRVNLLQKRKSEIEALTGEKFQVQEKLNQAQVQQASSQAEVIAVTDAHRAAKANANMPSSAMPSTDFNTGVSPTNAFSNDPSPVSTFSNGQSPTSMFSNDLTPTSQFTTGPSSNAFANEPDAFANEPDAFATEPDAFATEPNAFATSEPNAFATSDPNAFATSEPNAFATSDPNAFATSEPNAFATSDPSPFTDDSPFTTTNSDPSPFTDEPSPFTAPAPTPAPVPQEEYKNGDVLIYLPTGEAVEVVKVHKEDFPNPPYYAIKMQDLREKQTTFEKLKKGENLVAPKEPEKEEAPMLALPMAPGGGTVAPPAPAPGVDKPKPPENLVGTPDIAVYGQVLSMVHYQEAAQAVFSAFNGFFDDIRLRKGWKKAPFTQDDMKIIFHVVAQIVAVLRARLDAARDGISLRKIDGDATEFLWGLEKNPNPLIQGQDRSYVATTLAGLAKATMSDANGFVEGMDEPTVMAFVRCHPWVLQHILGQPVPGQQQPEQAGQPAAQ